MTTRDLTADELEAALREAVREFEASMPDALDEQLRRAHEDDPPWWATKPVMQWQGERGEG